MNRNPTPLPLVDFYRGNATDDRGRYLADILAWDNDRLEAVHDFIQWLFPLREQSGANPGAPVLDDSQITAFNNDPHLQQRLRDSLIRMLRFYGLALKNGNVRKSSNWAQRKANWFLHPTHNDLRITRMLKCLRLLGLAAEARAFHHCLRELAKEPDCGFSERAQAYWDEVMLDTAGH